MFTVNSLAQKPPFDSFPEAEPPYYRIQYKASDQPGELVYPVNYTIWIPPSVKKLKGIVVHQHGCGTGSCSTGLAGAYDLHWQALAKKHQCALLSPSYEQRKGQDCALWCIPQNGSEKVFLKVLKDFGEKSEHPELEHVPWALWGHSGGAAWVGFMTMRHPEKVAAVWMNSGRPIVQAIPGKPNVKFSKIPDEAYQIPMMCNLGTQEGVTFKGGKQAGMWNAIRSFFHQIRSRGGLIGIAVDPLTGHAAGNQRYLAIPWMSACLDARLPLGEDGNLRLMPVEEAWLAPLLGDEATVVSDYRADKKTSVWLPNEEIAKAWQQYVRNTKISDITNPPAPFNIQSNNGVITWEAEADLESGVAHFIIERDGEVIGKIPDEDSNPNSRPVFQGMRDSDTPTLPLREMQFTDKKRVVGKVYKYSVISVNTAGLRSVLIE